MAAILETTPILPETPSIQLSQDRTTLLFGKCVTVNGREYRVYAQRFNVQNGEAIQLDDNLSFCADAPAIFALAMEVLYKQIAQQTHLDPEKAIVEFIPGQTHQFDKCTVHSADQQDHQWKAEEMRIPKEEAKRFRNERIQTGLDVMRVANRALSGTAVTSKDGELRVRLSDFKRPVAAVEKSVPPAGNVEGEEFEDPIFADLDKVTGPDNVRYRALRAKSHQEFRARLEQLVKDPKTDDKDAKEWLYAICRRAHLHFHNIKGDGRGYAFHKANTHPPLSRAEFDRNHAIDVPIVHLGLSGKTAALKEHIRQQIFSNT